MGYSSKSKRTELEREYRQRINQKKKEIGFRNALCSLQLLPLLLSPVSLGKYLNLFHLKNKGITFTFVEIK